MKIIISTILLNLLLSLSVQATTVDHGILGDLSTYQELNSELYSTEDTLVFTDINGRTDAGFVGYNGNNQWKYIASHPDMVSDMTAYYIRFQGEPALLGIPAETGTLTVGANNEIADLFTDRKFFRPVVFVSFEDPNLTPGVSIVPTAPILTSRQFSFDVRFASGYSADLSGAKVHYMVAEEGWHKLADGRTLLISSADMKNTGMGDYKQIALGAVFSDAAVVTQLQRPMLYHDGYNFRNLEDATAYQGSSIKSGYGTLNTLNLRFMREKSVEAVSGNIEFAGRIGFMVLGTITSMESEIKVHKDTSTNIRGGSYLTVPLTHFNNYPHSAATSPLMNKTACAEDDDVQNFCVYTTPPVDIFSRSIFDTPRLPYMNENFEPLQMQRTFYSDAWSGWGSGAAENAKNPITDSDNQPIQGTLAKMFPNFVADRGWNAVLIGSNDYWHWLATYHFNTCTKNDVNPACVDFLPGDTIVDDGDILWTAYETSYNYYDGRLGSDLSSLSLEQKLLKVGDVTLVDEDQGGEGLYPPQTAAGQTLDYLNFSPPYGFSYLTPRDYLTISAAEMKEQLEQTGEAWQLGFINPVAYATESWCDNCDSIPTFPTGAWRSGEVHQYYVPTSMTESVYIRDVGFLFGTNVRPHVDKVGQTLEPGDYLFANVPQSISASNYAWYRSPSKTADSSVSVAVGVLGYQATVEDGNQYITMCMTYNGERRCGDWFKVAQVPFVEDVKIVPQWLQPIPGRLLTGTYTYIAPTEDSEGAEHNSFYEWQSLQNGEWVTKEDVTPRFYYNEFEVGDRVRFCVTPKTVDDVYGYQTCSAPITMQRDSDGDGIADDWDNDDDNDLRIDSEDAFPYDNTEWLDSDGDGIGDNADTDDDNDGLSDEDELAANTDPFVADTDGDGVNDADDPRPTVYGDLPDFDGDGIADADDDDIDGDGVVDFVTHTYNDETHYIVIDEDPYSACTSNAITVTSNADSGPGTLRQAVLDICSTDMYSNPNTIDFDGPMTITLQSPIVIDRGLNINGNFEVVIEGNNTETLFIASIVNGMENTKFPSFYGLTLRNGAASVEGFGSAIHVASSPSLSVENLFIENMTAPVIRGENFHLYMKNSLIANVTGADTAISLDEGILSFKNSTLYNSEGGALAIYGEAKVQLTNTMMLKGPNGSTACYNISSWEQNFNNWVEGDECDVTSTGEVILADPDNGDYRPLWGSATIDAGYTDEADDFNLDVLGNPRLIGVHIPSQNLYAVVDIGAFEYGTKGDYDGDGMPDADDYFPWDPNEHTDLDYDGVGDNSDAFPNDPDEWLDTDGDGIGNNADLDDDGDGWSDASEIELGTDPLNPASVPVDTDGDQVPDDVDNDDDNDGVPDTEDAFPLDAAEWLDTDNDGIGNNTDLDDDGDGVVDAEDIFPLDEAEWEDSDNDSIGNNADTDDDNDGVADAEDAFPLDATESVDTDGDGIGNNADTDDDNDSVTDADDAFPLDASESVDSDGDGTGNNADTDDDNDGVSDTDDAFPLDASESADTDGDGIGNNADTDDDNDSVADADDAFPLDASESVDTDGDGTGNNADTDDDNDGVIDTDDAFPLDATESADTDGDGIGNNADTDDDNDSVADADDAFPLDAAESVDTDGDGTGNNADTDDDNDGVQDSEDAFPLDSSEWSDMDGDGIGDNADEDRDNDGVNDDAEPNTAPVVDLTVWQNGQMVSTVFIDEGPFELVANVVDGNPLDTHSYTWEDINAGTSAVTIDPEEAGPGMHFYSVTVTDSAQTPLSGKATVSVMIFNVAPMLSDEDDSDNDGIPDSEEGFGDADQDRIPDYLDAISEENQLQTSDTDAPMQTEEGLRLILGDIAFAAGRAGAGLSLDDLSSQSGNAADAGFRPAGTLADFIILNVPVGGSAKVVIPQSQPIPQRASYRKFVPQSGWKPFNTDEYNMIASAMGTDGVCPAAGSDLYTSGLTVGDDCVQLTIQDGGPNDSDNTADGIIHDPSVVAQAVAEPTVSVENTSVEGLVFEQGDGESVVLSFNLVSDSENVQMHELTLQASGEIDETADVSGVRLYADTDRNGEFSASELIGEGVYSNDDGAMTFVFDEPLLLAEGNTSFAITYEF